MGFDDETRIVVAEGLPPQSPPTPRPASGSGRKTAGKTTNSAKTATTTSSFATPARGVMGQKPDGYGTVSCAHTFPTGLVVTTRSDGTVRLGCR